MRWHVESLKTDVGALAFRPDGKVIALGGAYPTLFDAATGKDLLRLDDHRGTVWSLAFSRDGKRLATGAADGTAMVWDVSQIAH